MWLALLTPWSKSRVSRLSVPQLTAPDTTEPVRHCSSLHRQLDVPYLKWVVGLAGFGTRDRVLTRSEVFPQAVKKKKKAIDRTKEMS